MTRGKIAVLISGSGSNLQALIDSFDGRNRGEIALVVSNRADAFGLQRAAKAGIEHIHLPKYKSQSRADYDDLLSQTLKEKDIEWVVCAGFMRILGSAFVQEWRERIINIHPSLLPAFPGTEAIKQAINARVRIAGATVHFVDEGTDTGPIIAQSAIAVGNLDTVETLKARVLVTEHKLLPRAVMWAVDGRISINDGVVTISEAEQPVISIFSPIVESE